MYLLPLHRDRYYNFYLRYLHSVVLTENIVSLYWRKRTYSGLSYNKECLARNLSPDKGQHSFQPRYPLLRLPVSCQLGAGRLSFMPREEVGLGFWGGVGRSVRSTRKARSLEYFLLCNKTLFLGRRSNQPE